MAKMPKATGELISAQNILAKAGIADKMRVADFGCGDTGYFIIPAAQLVGPRGVAYALDIQKSALDGVRNQAKIQDITNIEYVWTNLEIVGAAKIADASLDAVLIINNLHQSQKRGEILREALRLLKINGTLLAVDWKKIGTPFGPLLSDRVDPDEIKRLAQGLGFKLKEEFEAGSYHYGLIFKKEI